MTSDEKLSIEELIEEIKNLPKEESIIKYRELLSELHEVSFGDENLKWLHLYYQAICWVRMGFIEGNNTKKDYYFDKAEKFLEQAFTTNAKESELYVLKALLNQGRILVAVVSRGMRYISSIETDLRKAKSLNPKNPRAHFLLGQSYLNKPGFIGGSKSTALYHFKKAKQLFEQQSENQSRFYPTWGDWQNEEELNKLL